MARLPPSANTHVNDEGLIYGDDFNDSYFSRDDGLAESRTVFLSGCGLPDAWADRTCFVIGELGFGTGLNILATWDLWRRTRPEGGVLHIVTVEGFLLEADTAKTAHTMWPQLRDLSDQLIAKWPTRAFGPQRIWFPGDGLCITFLIGSCEQALADMSFEADCWFLDGFSPARNPDMWSPGVMAQVARLSAPYARLATYSVAGHVRTGLAQVGFEVKRAPGFGSKRERLEAYRTGASGIVPKRPTSAIVMGGGIAGASICAALRRRGVHVDLFDADPCGTTKASGNPVALIMPRLDRGDTRESRFFRAAYLAALSAYQDMGKDAFVPLGCHEVSGDPDGIARLVNLAADPPLPASHIESLDGVSLLHLKGGIAYPDAVLKHLGQGATHHARAIASLKYDGGWEALDHTGKIMATADMCVIASGPAAGQFSGLGPSLRGRAGQLSWAPVMGALPALPISGGAYGAPFHNRLVFGATFEHCDVSAPAPPVRQSTHVQNRDMLATIASALAAGIDLEKAGGRTSVRATTNDQLPIIGAIEGEGPHKYVLCALGSRGFTSAFLCAEMIAAQACGEPSPVDMAVREALAPDRFAKRAARRPAKRES